MSRVRRFIDTDVLTEARRRLHHMMDTFDGWVVAFSGGKDSLACLHLVRQVMDERGDRRPVRAVFRDEEFIPDGVVEFVARLREEAWLDIEWWAAPARASHMILGSVYEHVAFDPEREWARQPPEWALGVDELGLTPGQVIGQHEADALTVRNMRGRCAIITGVRAAESMMRYRSCVNKLHENYIVASATKKASLVRPIYDWQENDVFRFFYDYDIDYCTVYDAQIWAGENLRVSTPMHSESAKKLHNLGAHAPELLDRVLRLFPEMAVQARYWRELDTDGQKVRYGESFGTIREWIDENITDPQAHARAIRELDGVIVRAARQPESYPAPHVLNGFMTHQGKRTITPLRPDESEQAIRTHNRRKERLA